MTLRFTQQVRTTVRVLLSLAVLFVVGCSVAWARAYSPYTCYQALSGRWSEFPALVCDSRLGMTFIFRLDSLANVVAVVGWSFSYVVAVGAASIFLLRRRGTFPATFFAFTASAVLWFLLILSVDRSPYDCAFGFGGFSCGGFLSYLGLYVTFLGWLFWGAARYPARRKAAK